MGTLVGKTTEQLEEIALAHGEKRFRGRQMAEWLYRRNARSLDEMTDLPRAFRERLTESGLTVSPLSIVRAEAAPDGTRKWLVAAGDDAYRVECVLMPSEDRVSACISTQAGCPMGCTFCATAIGGLQRNLTTGEAVDQILLMQRESGRRVSHVVFMGMGEPLLNLDAVVETLHLLNREVGIGMRRITVSTVGIVPAIRRLADLDLQITLAVSLHAPEDELRKRLMPVGKKWDLAELLDACRYYLSRTGRRLTFEYLMIAGVNDEPAHAEQLAGLVKEFAADTHVNLIPFNFVDTGYGYSRPDAERVRTFRQVLERHGVRTTQRRERGQRIAAACGQLRQKDRQSDLPLLPRRPAPPRPREPEAVGG